MIEINLIPQKVKKAKKMQMVILAAGAGGAVIAVGMLAFVFYWQSKTAAIESQIKKIDAESASLQDKIAEVKRITAMEDTYKKKKSIIDSLLLAQSMWPELLDRVGEMLLPDMWLTSLQQDRLKDEGVIIKIQGLALSKVVIADFLNRLESSSLIMDLKAAQIGDRLVDNVPVVYFDIVFLYKYKTK
jgi:Tfp pilus assembly protein PilN